MSYLAFITDIAGARRTIRHLGATLGLLALVGVESAQAQVPVLLAHQGRVLVGGTDFNGAGHFLFALINLNADGSITYCWTSDGTNGAPPTEPVPVAVTNGLYSILLGDSSVMLENNAPMSPILASSLAENPNLRLRTWFNDGVNGVQLLSPDERLAPNGYLPNAAVSTNTLTASAVQSTQIAAGTITGANVANGAIQAGQLSVDAAVANIQAGTITAAHLAPGAAVANLQPGQISSAQLAPQLVSSLQGSLQQGQLAPTFTVTENVAVGDAIAIATNQLNNVRLQKASATAGGRFAFFGFASAAATAGNSVLVTQFGAMSGFSGLTTGSKYYLGMTNGAITSALPASNVIYVGFALAPDTLFVDPFGVTANW